MTKDEMLDFFNADENVTVEEALHLSFLHEKTAKTYILRASTHTQLPFVMFGPVWHREEIRAIHNRPIEDLIKSEFHNAMAIKCMDIFIKLTNPNSFSKTEWLGRAANFEKAINHLPLVINSQELLLQKTKSWQVEIIRCQKFAAQKDNIIDEFCIENNAPSF